MQRQTIMVVDDIADHRLILHRLLSAQGYRVLAVELGADVVHQACTEQPDLIVLALPLPGQASWETAQQLHSQPALSNTPILGTTVYNTLHTPRRVRAIGCVDYVDKPFDIDQLLERINQLLTQDPGPALAA